jgi:hypothetical protein
MKNFKAKIASIHEDLELRRSLEIEEDKTPTFDDKDWILRDVYGHIKRTIKTFDPEGEEDQVNHLMAGLKQAADQIESRYTGGPRTTFFNAAEDAEGNSNFEQEVFDKLSDLEAEIETKRYSQEDIVDHVADEIAREKNIEVTTEQGAVIETKVEEYFAMLNLPHPPHRVSRDALSTQEGTEKSWWVVKAKVVPNPDYSGPPKAHATHVEVTAPIHANDEAIIAKIEDQYPQHKVVEIDKYESSYDRGQEFRRG